MQRILTGDRPTGPLHLGHYVGSLKNRVQLQHTYEQFVMIADVQALTDNFEHPQQITSNVYDIVKDYLSVGLDPEKTTIFLQSYVPEIQELTLYYLNLVTIGRLERNPTVKAEIKQKGFAEAIPAGFLCYPVSQAADITIFHAECVPVGGDQIPMIEQTNEIVRKFNRVYQTTYLKECRAYLSDVSRLVGLDGKAKASKSLGNALFLSDSSAIIKEKVFQMYTDPNHLRISNPGRVDGNVVFAYLDAFYADKEALQSLKDHYQRGGLGDVEIKKKLQTTLEILLDPIRTKRQSFTNKTIKEILQHGNQKAREIAQRTIYHVRDVIGLNHLNSL